MWIPNLKPLVFLSSPLSDKYVGTYEKKPKNKTKVAGIFWSHPVWLKQRDWKMNRISEIGKYLEWEWDIGRIDEGKTVIGKKKLERKKTNFE